MANTYVYSVSGEPLTLLSANATGVGTTIFQGSKERGGFQQKYTWSTVITGSPASLSVRIEGSLDGTNFSTLDTSTNTSGEIRAVVNTPVVYVRANLTALSGGSSPTVTVQFMAVAP